jgi:NADH:ubiquinone oxidoreductase subunit E
VQHHYGYIAAQAMVEIALFLEITPGDVLDTASFYEDYHLEPVGKYVVAVCQSIACEVCGHQAIVDYVREKLDIEPHETTDDGKFTLLTMECLGACDTAPCALVNDQRYDNLSITSLEKILESLPD